MITEDYVNLKIAKLLKDKGFASDDCIAFYNSKGEIGFLQTFGDISEYLDDDSNIDAPTINMALKWLILEHKIYIRADYIDFLEHGEVWAATIVMMKTFKEIKVENTESTREEALEFALEYCLENLI